MSTSILLNKGLPETYYTSLPSLPPDEINSERIRRIQTSINKCTNSRFSDGQIREFCRNADQIQKPRIPGIRTILKDVHRQRSFLLITHFTNGNDRIIGQGAFKKVKFAIDLNSGKIFAVGVSKEQRHVKNVNSEVEMLNCCKRIDQIVRLHFSYHLKDTAKREKCYLIMDYYENGDLSKYIALATGSQKHQWTSEIAEGLVAMHEEGVFHRDLKPENIFITQDGHIKIGDLGHATQEHSTKDEVGTGKYMAPEVIGPEVPYQSNKADAWSFGCLAFELLTGHSLFTDFFDFLDNSNEDYINSKIKRANIDTEYKDLLKGLLTINPDERWTVQKFLSEFQKLPIPD